MCMCRGVHQTFPTKRWEAQFRRNGKPTSLGCFDQVSSFIRVLDLGAGFYGSCQDPSIPFCLVS